MQIFGGHKTSSTSDNKENKDNSESKSKEPETSGTTTTSTTSTTSTTWYKTVGGSVSSAVSTVVNTTDTKVLPYWTTLARITHGDAQEYERCCHLCDQIDAQLKLHGEKVPTKQPQTTWEELSAAAETCQPKLIESVEILCNLIKKERPEANPETIKPPTKKKGRATEKCNVDYGGDWTQMKDVSRSALIHDQFSDCAVVLATLLQQLKEGPGKDSPKILFNVARIKNRYDQLTSHGWGDIHLLLCSSIPLEDGKILTHICELQIIHRKMWDKRDSGMFGHKYYEIDRTIRAKMHEGGDVFGQAKTVDVILDGTDHVKTEAAKVVFVKKVNHQDSKEQE